MSKSIEINFLTDFFEISKVNIIMSCRVHGKQNQVPNFKLFEAYFRQLLGALPVCNAFFQFSRGIFASQKFYDFTCCLGWVGGGGHFWIAINLLKYVPFYSHCMHVLENMLTFHQELARSTDINLKDAFAFYPLFRFRLVMKWELNL